MGASLPENALVVTVALPQAEQTEAAPLHSGSANPPWDSPLPQPLCESVFPQQNRVTERERAVHHFGKYSLRVPAGSDGKQIHLNSKVKILFLIPCVKTRLFFVLLF